jgi:hypothetical protein
MNKTEKSGKYFALATPATNDLCRKLIYLCHADLDSTAAKVDVVMAYRAPDSEEPAMVERGHRILGKASITKLKDRVKGMGDAEILLDGDMWEELLEKQKAALLDHELYHLEVKRDKTGEFVFDDLNRPLLKIREHDREFGWFDVIAQRHRGESTEIHQLQRLFAEAGQIYLPFVNPEGSLEERDDKDSAETDARVSGPLDKLRDVVERSGNTVSIKVGDNPPVELGKPRVYKLDPKKGFE